MNKKLATYICCLVMMVFAMNLTIISPLLTDISKYFGVSISKAGTLFTAEFVGFLLFVIIGGLLADKLGKKMILSVAVCGLTITLFLFALVGNFYLELLIMLLMGGFGGTIESVAMSMVADLNDKNKSFYINLSQVFFGVGAIIGPIMAGLFISGGLGWNACYVLIAILMAIVSLAFIFCKMPELPKEPSINFRQLQKELMNKRFLLICLCMAFYVGAEVGGWGWLSTYLKKSMSFSIEKSGIAIAVFWVAMTIGRLICGLLTKRFKVLYIIMVLAFLASAATFLSIFIHIEALIWIIIALMGLTYSSQFPLIASYGSEISGVPSGTSVSILVSSGSIGGMSVPYLMGVVGEKFDMRFSMLLPSVLLLLIGMIFIGLGWNKQKSLSRI